MDLRHVRLIAAYSTRYSIRGGVGLVFLLLSLTFGLTVAHLVMQPAEMAVKAAAKSGFGVTTTEKIISDLKSTPIVRNGVSWVLGAGETADIADATERQEAEEFYERWTAHLLDDHPAILSTILLILLFGWPMIASMGAFNLFSSDVQSRGLRYHLIRADRSSIFWGRTLGMIASQSVVILVLVLTVVLYMGSKLPFYGWGSLFMWGAYGVGMLIVVSLPYIALCAWISAAIDAPIAALTVISLIMGGVPLFSFIGRVSWKPLEYVNYLLPWSTQNYLHSPSLFHVFASAVGCLGYAAVFLFIGHRHFLKRDL